MRGGKLIQLLFCVSLLAFVVGLLFPIILEHIFKVEEYLSQKRAETVVEQAAQWYIITQGAPNHTLLTNEVKKALIPNYLNKWPGKEPIECTISPNGNIKVQTEEDKDDSWLQEVILHGYGEPED